MKVLKGKDAEKSYNRNIEKMEKGYDLKVDDLKNVPVLGKNHHSTTFYQNPKDKPNDSINLNKLLEMEEEMEEKLTKDIIKQLHGFDVKVNEIVYDDFQKWLDNMKGNIHREDIINSSNPRMRMIGYNFVENEEIQLNMIELSVVKDYMGKKDKALIDDTLLKIICVQSNDDMMSDVRKVVKELGESK